jgi:hypothetical protein
MVAGTRNSLARCHPAPSSSEAVEKMIYESIVMNLQESFFSQRFSGYPDFLNFSYTCILGASLSFIHLKLYAYAIP